VDLNGDGDRSDAGESTTIDGLVGPGLGSEQMQMVNTGDAALGALVKQLEETDDPRNPGHKLINNTLIIFTADNGGIGKDSFFGKPDLTDYGHDSSGGLKGAKARKDEGGLRVPFVAKWAGHIEEGSVSDQLVGTHDLMATLAGLTGQSLASDQANDSFNLLSVILGHQSDVDPVRDHLITQHTGGSDPIRANIYYENDWKLIVDWNDLVAPNIMALFDLSTDPRETSDLKDSTDPIVQQLLADLYSNYLTVRNANRTAPVLTQLSADFNADGIVSIDDRNNWDEGYGIGADAYFMNGDADRDGDVEGADFLAWQRSIESIFPGDIDQDGDGDGKEFLDWKINFADPAESSSPTNPVPEPPMLWGSVCCLLFFSSNWRSRQRKDGTLKC